MNRKLVCALSCLVTLVLIALPAFAAVKVGTPDLTITHSSLESGQGKPGATTIFNITTRNIGTADSGAYYVGFYLSVDETLSPGTLDPQIGESLFPVLAQGASYPSSGNDRQVTLTIPATAAPGAYFIYAYVDSHAAISESVEGNNLVHLPFTVLPFTCGGLEATNPNVCQAHGTCTADDVCTCTSAWTGPTCATSACSGGCGTNAHCVGEDECECNEGYTMTLNGCKETQCAGRDDWTRCTATKAVPAACFNERCEELASNDTCGLAEPLYLSATVNDSLYGNHSSKPVQLPLWSAPLSGRDAFYVVDMEKDNCYRLTLTTGSDLMAFLALWQGCDTLLDASAVADYEETVTLDACAAVSQQHVVQVVQQLPPKGAVKRPSWHYDLIVTETGCVANAKSCEGTVVYTCVDDVWVAGTDCGEAGCADGECGCTPGSKRCAQTDIGNVCTENHDCESGLCLNEACKPVTIEECEGGVWSTVETCDASVDMCLEGACKPWATIDGDTDETADGDATEADSEQTDGDTAAPDGDDSDTDIVEDGDTTETEDDSVSPSDGDLDNDATEIDEIIDPTTGGKKSSGGCRQSGASGASWLLLSFMGLALLRRRLGA